MKIAIFAVAAVALLPGCVLPPQPSPTPQPSFEDQSAQMWQRLTNGLNSLYGQNIHAAVAVFGYPTSDQTVMGDQVFNWESESTFPATVDMGPLRMYCKIQIGVAQDGTIKNSHYDGNVGGCQRYANAFPR